MKQNKLSQSYPTIIMVGVSLLTLITPISTHAQQWSGILSSSRAINWSNAGVVGGIPQRTTICSTLNPGATAAQINSAISSCPSGQVVYLNAGTYNLSGGITIARSNVTLRGAGANQTNLVFSNGVSCNGLYSSICVRSTYIDPTAPQNSANWTAGYAKGTSTVTLSSIANLSVGHMLVLNQLNDTTLSGVNIPICSSTSNPVCSYGGPGGGGLTNSREQLEFARVTAINGNNVTIASPLAMPNWSSGKTPRAWWVTASPASEVGIEDLSIDSTNSDNGIILMTVRDSWVKGIKSIFPSRAHVWIHSAMNVTVRDSYFYEGQNHASQSYGVEVLMGSNNLVENNIFLKVTAPLMSTGAATGTVFAYNYSLDDTYFNAAWMQPSSYFHATGTGYILHEGNQGAGIISDNVHGPSHFITAFRNQWEGWETGKTAQTVPVHVYALSRYWNIIGNVLGRSGYHKKYTSTQSDQSNCYYSIYAFGMGNNCYSGGGSFPADDPQVATTIMRWGNYDVVNAAPRFVASEVPSSISAYSNAIPASQALPASFYLVSKPSWWGTMPWPAVGPDVTGGDISGKGGYAWRNPARVCYDNSSKDANSAITSYNANACYVGAEGGSVPPGPPSNVR